MPETNREEFGSRLNLERQMLQRMYAQVDGAYRSQPMLVKAINLPVSKTTQVWIQRIPLQKMF